MTTTKSARVTSYMRGMQGQWIQRRRRYVTDARAAQLRDVSDLGNGWKREIRYTDGRTETVAP